MSQDKKILVDKPLVVYKASAGSGKTFALTLYYLWLLFSTNSGETEYDRNRRYRNILAVTFTNKATGEMKARIIKSLFNLAMGVSDKNTTTYINELLATGCVKSADELKERAKDVLYTLLHDYTNFNVSTIDAFFQKTMRAFVRDIGMQGGYNVELDSESLANEAIDRMYLSLSDVDTEGGDKSIKMLNEWLLTFDIDQIEDGKKWNSAEFKIRTFSKQLFKDEYKKWRNGLSETEIPTKDDIYKFNEYLNEKIKEKKEEYDNIVYGAQKIVDGIDVQELIGKTRSPLNYFINPDRDIKLPPPSLFRELIKKDISGDTKNRVETLHAGGYFDKLSQFFGLTGVSECSYFDYCKYKILQSNLYSFGILSDIDTHIRDINKERNTMLLSDTTDLLSNIIKDTDTPFIYEKTGVNIHHFMIDEFQDTSLSQWENFLPLLRESIANGGRNLIVGDVKQSIYRWRNSDWSLLNGLPDSEQTFKDNGAVSLPMDVNWRSMPNIIQFNNKFIAGAVEILKRNNSIEGDETLIDMLNTAYNNSSQKCDNKKAAGTGYVKIEFVNAPKREHDSEYEKDVLQKLYDEIQNLIKAGCSADEMAILTRENDEAAMIAQYLMSVQKEEDERFYVISDEALKIKNSEAVKAIIAVMRYINDSEDTLNSMMMNYEVKFSELKEREGAFKDSLPIFKSGIPEDILDKIRDISTHSLYEMSEVIVDMLSLKDSVEQLPYLQAFQDSVLTYMSQNGNSLSKFLDWWNLKSDKLAISTPETENAIRIMTIHKSKGLEFSTLFIPFCNWKIEKGSDYLWQSPDVEGKEHWKLPLSVSSKMLESPYRGDYLYEKSLSIIDNLNLAYVAFTRAKCNLIVYSPLPKYDKDKKVASFNSLLYGVLCNMNEDKELGLFNDDKYELGSLCIMQSDKKDSDKVVEISKYDVAPIDKKLHLKLKGESYFDEHSNLSIGKIKHEMMSEIVVKEDVSRIAKKYEKLGVISPGEATDFINEILSQIEDNALIGEWFALGNKVLNESSVLNNKSDGKISYRPDRVIINGNNVTVVDYKFGKESDKYNKQIESYISILKTMGYFNVKGYIWYVSERRVV